MAISTVIVGAYEDIDCGNPKDIAGATNSYETTTYKSEVTYTCPEGEQLKSVCEKNNKWTPVVETCNDPQIHFVKVKGAALDVPGKLLWKKKNVTAKACAEKCLSDKKCLSFEINKENGKCFLSKQTASSSKKIKKVKNKDYYQRVKSDEGPVMLKKVSVPSKATLGRLKDKTLKKCKNSCQQYTGCNSYQYNAEAKLCDLSNVTQLNDELKPNDGSWDIFLTNPVVTKVNCGPPKDVVGAKKSYTDTTYKSEVTYTCPGGQQLKSKCKDDNKWTPVASNCEVSKIHFVKVKGAVLDVPGKTLASNKSVTADVCAERCLSDKNCLSFEITEETGKCYLSKESAAFSKKIKAAKSRDYYQRVNPNKDILKFKRTSIPREDAFKRQENMTLKECDHACHQTPGCNSYEYDKKAKFCDQSNATHLTHDLQPDQKDWDIYVINPAFANINCGLPKDIVGTSKSYKTTAYKSEVLYTCSDGVQLKSICQKDNKWTPVTSSCKDPQLHFVKIKDAALDVPGKTLLDKEDVTADECAEKCLSDESCLSFEINKKNRKCYLSEKSAATSKKLKADKDKDYYHRLKLDDKPFMMKKVSIPKKTKIEELQDMKLKECDEACSQYAGCNSYQYNKKKKICDLSNVTQLSDELKPNNGSWDIYIVNPVITKINCGPPKDVVGASKSYNTTTYKSEVIYTCQKGGILKATCKENRKWAPVVSCKVTKSKFLKVKSAMLDVPGKTLWRKKNVTAEACVEKCSSDTNCLSFEITKGSGRCYLSKATAASNKKIKEANRDYYQRVDPDDDVFTFKRTAIPGHDSPDRIKGISLKECDRACLQIPGCKSYEYHEKKKFCNPSNETHLTYDLKPNKDGWDIHIMNPVYSKIKCGRPRDIAGVLMSYNSTTYRSEVTYTCPDREELKSKCEKDRKWTSVDSVCEVFKHIDCGNPKDIAGATKSYDTTTYKSEVTYTCPEGEKLKSTCEKDNKWTPIVETCNDPQIHFVKVKGAALDVPGKLLWKKKKVTAKACAEKCLSDKKCLSFEINTENGKCFLSKQTASSSKKIKKVKNKDYYQRVKLDEEPVMLKKVSIPSNAISGRLKDKTLKECDKACQQYIRCNTYQYNAKSKVCDLSNVTQLNDELKPNDGDWDIYIVNPVITKINCGPPKDVVGAKKSYTDTTYKSEVTYTCPGGQQLKSKCKDDNKWTPVASNCKVSKIYFVKVKGAILDIPGKTLGSKKNVTADVCAEKCLSDKNCLSFEIKGESGKCYLSQETAASSKKIKAAKTKDYYQRVNADDDILKFKSTIIPGEDIFKRLKNVTLKECDHACHQTPGCNSYEYKERVMFCDRSNVTHLTRDLEHNEDGWDTYVINPAYANIKCGPPKDIVGTLKSYKTTAYNSEVLYTCPDGIQLRSICQKHNKWTPVASSCKDPLVQFVKIKDSALDVPEKTLLDKKDVTADECAEKCLSGKSCLSFEINKENGKCYLSKKSAATAKKLKADKDKDYYQRLKFDDKPLVMKKVSVPRNATVEELEDVNLKECSEACNQYLRCNSYQYNEHDKICDLSNVTQLSDELKPNNGSWDIYIVNPVVTKINCGAPKDVAGASKSYSTTTYKSEVIYTCQDGEELKATCKENKKWAPEVSCKATKINFVKVKGAILDVPGKTLWNKKNVSAEACAEKCISDNTCLSFEITKKSQKCYLSKETAASIKKMKTAKDRDYYQQVKPDDDVFTFKRTAIPGHDSPDRIKGISLKECDRACLQIPGCKSYEYHEQKKFCNPSNETHLTYDLKPNKDGWDIHIMNPAYNKINCGPPRDIAGASKSYNTTKYRSEVIYTCPREEKLVSKCEKDKKWTVVDSGCEVYANIDCGNPKDIAGAAMSYDTTTYKSEVTYTCPEGEKLKSTCEKDNKWTLIVETCNDPQIHFVKVKGAALDVAGKIFWNKENVTAKACAEKCLSVPNCLSFELSNENGQCFLLRQAASSSEKIKTVSSKDYYQRVKHDEGPIMLQKVGIPSKAILGRLKDKTLKECKKACEQYTECNAYQYNDESKLCDLSNVTQLNDELKPNDGSWDIFLTNPVVTKVNCGPPKDVGGAKKSYTDTTYKSEVTYTCPGGQQLKSKCKDDNKWTPVASNCKVSKIYFVKVKGAVLDVPGKTLLENKSITADVCAEKCLSDTNCLSFEIKKESGKCYLSKVTAASTKKMKAAKSRDYYQRVEPDDDILKFKSTSILGKDTFKRQENVTLKECDHACHQTPGCNSYEYKEKAKLCDPSNATHLTHDLEPNKKGWDTYVINPAYANVNCGPPKDIVNTSKSYKTTAYKSEVLYTCSNGVQLKSICQKDNKWTPVGSSCKDPQINFVKIKDTALDVPGKTSLDKEDVTADECAEECLSDESCLSFEINKENGKCYLSEKSAATSKKLKGDKDTDYYQRVTPDDKPFMIRKVSVSKKTKIGRLQDVKLKDCNKVCNHYAGCNSYQYNEQEKMCDLSNVTQMSNELKPNNGSWDIYIINPVVTKINCGPPKDVVGASKSYDTTTYESEVIYTCHDGKELKATCKEDKKWAPEVSCKVTKVNFVRVKDAILDVPGKTLLRKKNVSTEFCAEKCLSDKTCLSFEITKASGKCYLSKETAATSKKIKSAKDRDYYQQVDSDDDLLTLKKIAIPGHDSPDRIKGISLKECDRACLQIPGCKSYEYHEQNKSCIPSNETHLTYDLKPNKDGWDIHIMNPANDKINCGPPRDIAGASKSCASSNYRDEVIYTCPLGEKLRSKCEKDNKWTSVDSTCKTYKDIDCGNPKDIAGAEKSYDATTYKSEVTYTCPKGEKLKSICEKDNKWSPIVETCNDAQIHFVKVKSAALSVSGKILWKTKNITADDCAEKCLSTKICLSFEINTEMGKCSLSKQTAASSKKIKSTKSRDYYQRVNFDEGLITMKKVGIPSKAILVELKNRTLKECEKACHQYIECNSYQYNEQDKLCDLSNMTQLSDKLKPNDGNWDIYLPNPVVTKVNCGPPKDVGGAKKSYTDTTYKSEVTYTCPGGQQLKSKCKDDNKWTPVASNCKVSKINFVKVDSALLDVPGKILWNKKNVTADTCAEKCLSDENCLSFEITKTSRKCYLSKDTAASTKKIKAAKSRDYYQRVNPEDVHFTLKKTAIPQHDTFEQIKDLSLKQCSRACHQTPGCTSYEYNEKEKFCDRSNVTHLTHDLKPNKWGWDIHIINPDHSIINCGLPKDIVGAKKFYRTDYYKSEVSYICSNQEVIKSTCEKNSKWTPVPSTCKDSETHFVKVKDALLDVPRKILMGEKSVTADACAKQCLSDENCLSFEINKDRKCYLSKQTAATSKKIKTSKNRDYYQRIQSDDQPLVLRNVSFPEQVTLKQLKDKILKECKESCHQYPGCNSFQYNKKDKLCDLSNVTHMTGVLKPNTGNWDVYIINPVHAKVTCGRPKNVAGASKSYDTTTYKSEVNYTCQDGEKLKAVCQKDKKWTPEVSCKVTQKYFVKARNGTLDVPEKLLWDKKNVTVEDCAAKCFSQNNCLSFEIYKENKCYLSKKTAATSKKIKSAKDKDYYQRVKPDDDVFTLKRTTIPFHDTFGQLEGISLKECDHACLQIPGCKSYEYHEKKEFCKPSNETHLTYDLKPNKDGWDIHIMNPAVSNISCEPPKDIAHTSKSYNSTIYRSEVTYTCPGGEKFKSTCGKDKKWTPMISLCKDFKNQFVKVNHSSLNVPEKILWKKKKVTAEACAKKCFSDKKCLSFEINKRIGKCFLSKKTAATSNNLKTDKNRDYYQRIKSKDKKIKLHKVSISEQDILGQLQNVNLKKCNEACHQHPECNSYQYNEKEMICDLSNGTHLTDKLKLNDGNGDTYIFDKVAKKYFVKVKNGTLDVPEKLLWHRKNITAEDCAKKCFSEKNCLSFEINKENRKCYLSKETAAASKKIKSAKDRDYYQRVKPDDDVFTLKRTAIPGHDSPDRIKEISLKECDRACLQIPGCKSYEYHEKYSYCDPSNKTHLTHDLKPNEDGWDIHLMNPVYSNINCGPPKDIARGSTFFNSTIYRSEVTYRCQNGEKLKSVCTKDNKWTSITSICKDVKSEFVKVNDAFLDVPEKKLWKKKNVTTDECAEKCLSNENCLSFEITKGSGKCFLSEKTADHTKKIKADKSKDYYQRIKSDDTKIKLHKVSIPEQDVLRQLKNVNLEKCNEACLQHSECNSYEYNKKEKVCDLSNVTHLTDKLKPSDGNRDVYIIDPVYSKINCEPPKDIVGANKSYNTTTYEAEVTYTCPEGDELKSVCKKDSKWSPVNSTCKVYAKINCGAPKEVTGASKSYKTTTYKSEVTYTCPEGEQLKSVCEKNNEWTPVAEACKVSQINFVKVKDAALDVSGKTLLKEKNVTADACAEACLTDEKCLSFEINKDDGKCFLSRQSAASTKKMKTVKSRDYYQRVKANKPVMFKKVSVPSKATLGQLKDKTLKECENSCQQYIECNSYQYNAEAKLCDLSKVTQLNDVFRFYQKVNCGPPKDVIGAKKSYNTTTFKSEVTYTCPEGEKLKSVCKEDHKWSPVVSACKAAQIHFVKVKDAVLDVSGKPLLHKKNVTADACAKECLSDKTCLSFEISKENGDCYLSRQTATTSKKMQSTNTSDYYQRIEPKDDLLILKSTSIPGHDTFERLENVSLKECNHACHQNPGCNSYEYNKKDMLCDQSNATHLTQDLLPNAWAWDTYIINPVNSEIKCGPPKDIVGAEKDYKSTNYKSEVTYTCPDEELQFNAKNRHHEDLSTVVHKFYSKIDCGPPKDIVGANKSYNTTTYETEVSYTCPEGEHLKSICKKDNKWSPVNSTCKVYAKINCGAPKEVTGASKSYKTTTYKSEVTYTCPEGEQLKSVCEKNNEWTPVAEACKVAQINFVKVKDAALDVSGKTLWKKKNVTEDDCATKCLTDKNCLSFEIKKEDGKCFLSKQTAASTKKMKTTKSRDYYQRVKANKPFMFKKVSIPKKDSVGQIKNKTLKECDKACQQYVGCNSYQYNEKDKLCDLNNASQSSDLLKPNNGNWDIYMVNPAYNKVDCGPPKDVAGAKKSYKTTTFKSEVTYTCPEGEKLKSVCKEDYKWSPVANACKAAQIHFVKVKDAVLDVSGKTLFHKKNITADACAKECLSDETCLSFEIKKENRECYLSKKTATKSKKMKSTQSNDYYQRIQPKDDLLIIKGTAIPGHDTFERLEDVSLKECGHACHQNPGCNSYEYNKKDMLCDQSNATHLTQDLLPNKWAWDTYIINPVNSKIKCGPPKDIVGAEKDYKSTDYKSEVTYTCPADETIKSTCEKNNKWSPIPLICNDTKKQFVKVKDAVLDVMGKKLLKNKNVTTEACVVKCLSDENCLSFEITKSGKCYLSKKTAATSKKLKAAKDRDYYQRIKPDDTKIMLPKVSIPEQDVLRQLKNVNLEKCNEACLQHSECNSYEYSEKEKACNLSEVTHLTDKLKPNDGNKDTYIIDPDYTKINCGPPKDILGAEKSYNTTTYKSEVIYICPGDELKSVCKKDNKWSPVNSTCKVYAKINCGTPKEVAGASKSYKTTTYKSEVTYTCPKAEQLKSVCEKNNKWSPVAEACEVSQINFVKVKDAALDVSGKTLWKEKNVTADACAEACLTDEECLSFEIKKDDGKCFLSKQTAASSKKMKTAKSRDYYQRVKANKPVMFKKVSMPSKATLGQLKDKTLKECENSCQQYVGCNSYQYNAEAKLCDLSKVTQLNDVLKPNDGNWDIYLINPVYKKVNCGPPKDVIGAKKSYNTTTFKSEVTYTCPEGEKLKSVCKEDHKWSPVVSACKAAQIHFVKVKDAVLDVSGKPLLHKKNVTADACAKECLSDKTCLSFEISKENGDCYLSKQTATKSKKMKSSKSRDYYQRIKSKDDVLILKSTSIPGHDTFERLENVSLKECGHACHQNPGCNSYEYNKKNMLCDQSNATHLTQDLLPNTWAWDTYIINPVNSEIKCGPPKDIVGAEKDYKSTNYKSEVTYTCPDEESFKSICEKNSKWTPVAPTCNVYSKINCGPPKDIVGAKKSYKTTTYKSEVTYTCPEEGKIKSVCKKDSKWSPVNSTCKVYAKINCGAPKEVTGASKSYKTTTYKSEVTYTCPKAEQLKSVCEKNNKWSPVAEACEVRQINFVKVKDAVLDVSGKILWRKEDVTADACAERCLSNKNCLSFEISKEDGNCYLSKQTAASTKKMKTTKSRDYYQRVKANKPVMFKKVSMPSKATLGQLKDKTLKECENSCQQYIECNSYQYNAEAKLCDLSNVTQLNDVLKPNDGNWDIYLINPAYTKVDCGPPKRVVGAKKSYKTTTFKSKVTYTCPKGEKFKSVCKEDRKWSPVVSACKATKIHFVKVKDAVLDVSGKTLFHKKNVTADACAKECLSDETCLSFEIKKESGGCYLSTQTATSSKKMKSSNSRDYYQRIKSKDDLLIIKSTAIPGHDTFERLENVSLKECGHACHQNPGCNSYEYNKKDMLCDQSNATHLTQDLLPNAWAWDTYIINPVNSEIKCGPPKDIVGAEKDYKSTNYKSEVTYTCPDEEAIKSTCEKNNKWTPVPPICNGNINSFSLVIFVNVILFYFCIR
ncbi:uncharacterized protein LOC106869390 [Octopus bimaculoides]|nr:uncharacterized protein LOC106869390 [Octopus bimaculoides]